MKKIGDLRRISLSPSRAQKKGLSPIVATVLLIALVLVLAAIIFLWARGFITEQIEKFGGNVEEACEGVAFDVELVSSGLGYELEIANRGNVDIFSFDIKEFVGGDSSIKQFKFSVDEGGAVRRPLTITSGTEKIEVYPALLGTVKGRATNKIYTCTEKGETLIL